MEEISGIFTKVNIRILRLLSGERLHLREIAGRIGCSPAKVHSCISVLKKHNIAKESNEKNKKIIELDLTNELTGRILEIINPGKSSQRGFMPENINLFDAISPIDFRYYARNSGIFEKLQPYLSESAFIKYALKVESALAGALADGRICPVKIAREIEKGCRNVNAGEVYSEEDRIRHNIRALVNCIRNKVSEDAKPFVHFTATSYDIIATADAMRYREFSTNILIPELERLILTLRGISLREKETLQIGRTHGQHAEPITFGFAMAQYVSRLGHCIAKIKSNTNNLRGKMSGAVGAYNASSLFLDDPVKFEEKVLGKLGLKPSSISTQVVQAEFLLDFLGGIVSAFGVMANLADDMRHLQRTEIAEVGEFFGGNQVGSSTMPQKRNPINFENVKSMWKEFMPRMMTMYMDQISEHQRDLTNSASMRFVPEILAGFFVSLVRLNKVMAKLAVDRKAMLKNFKMSRDIIVAEPLYILLAYYGHPNAHEYARLMSMKSKSSGKPLISLVKSDKSIRQYLKKFTGKQLEMLEHPENYIGIASKKVESICR